MQAPNALWQYGWRAIVLVGFFFAIVLLAATGAEYIDTMTKITEAEAMGRIPEGFAEFEVLIGSKNAGDVIHAVLTVKDEDIPKFFKGNAWTLLPPPPEGGDK